MKLVTYRLSGAEYVGALTADGKGVLPLPAADMNTLIETMTPADLRSAAAAAERGGAVPLSDVELLAPIPRPRQDVVCLGMNYRDHAEESARYSADAFTKSSTAAVYFSKRVSEAGKPDGVIPRHAGLTDRLDYEAELAVVRNQNIDITKFEEQMETFKSGFARNYDLASRKFQTAIDEIDKTILHLQKTKDALVSSENNLRLANNKAQDLTIKRLTRNNPTMKAAFEALAEEKGDARP